MIIDRRKARVLLGALTLCAGLYTGCNSGKSENAAVKAIASSANQELINLVRTNDDIKLVDVLNNADKYGLTEDEVSAVKENITDWDKKDYVLEWINPLNRTGAPHWAYVPQTNDSKDSDLLKSISSIDKDGQIDIIDGTKGPEQVNHPIITISLSEKIPGVEPLKLTSDGELAEKQPVKFGELVMTSVKFKFDHEPWIKGKAEIYYVMSYVTKDGKAVVTEPNTKQLPHVQHDGIDYNKNAYRTTVFSWFNAGYRRVDIHFFEHDGTDWKPIIKTLNDGIEGITQTIQAAKPETWAGIEIGSRVVEKFLELLPVGCFEDGDDYIDSIYTIRRRDTVGAEKLYEGENVSAKFITEDTYTEIEANPFASNGSDVEDEEDPLK